MYCQTRSTQFRCRPKYSNVEQATHDALMIGGARLLGFLLFLLFLLFMFDCIRTDLNTNAAEMKRALADTFSGLVNLLSRHKPCTTSKSRLRNRLLHYISNIVVGTSHCFDSDVCVRARELSKFTLDVSESTDGALVY